MEENNYEQVTPTETRKDPDYATISGADKHKPVSRKPRTMIRMLACIIALAVVGILMEIYIIYATLPQVTSQSTDVNLIKTTEASVNEVTPSKETAIPDDWSQRSAASGVLGSPTAEYPGVSSVAECLEVSGCVSDPDRYPWRCQTVHYEAGLCRVFPVSLALDPLSDDSGYWTRKLLVQDWIPVFRLRSGSFVDPYLSWLSNNTDPSGHSGVNPLMVRRGYRDRVVQIRMAMYVADSEVMFTTFNVHGSNRTSWMQHQHIISSSYDDIKTAAIQFGHYFSIYGYVDHRTVRRFYAYKSHAGCEQDYVWFVVKHGVPLACSWEIGDYPALFYCKQKTVCNAETLHRADRFVVSVKMG